MKVSILNEGRPAFPAWIRIAVGTCVAVTGALAFWTYPHDFLMGINQISLALFLFFMKSRQPNESLQKFIVKPRAIIAFASLLIIAASSLELIARSLR
jgi:hypothetical protein